ncbi:MAG: hypothetical protein E7F01_08940 [Veillonella sp.]|nr:hypothetical protein [Veillonella sp.]
MDSLRSFMDEMLNDQGRKEGFISDLLGNLKNQPTITYKVVPDMYQPYTLSFIQFEAVLEGLLTLRRNQKWQMQHNK